MRTNRDFYDYVVALPNTNRHLATYLRALATVVEPYRDADGIALEAFAELVREAMTAWPEKLSPGANAFQRGLWDQAAALSQRAVRRQSANLHVNQFLECGAQGAFNGWQAEGEGLEDISFLAWEDLTMFVGCGQYYE